MHQKLILHLISSLIFLTAVYRLWLQGIVLVQDACAPDESGCDSSKPKQSSRTLCPNLLCIGNAVSFQPCFPLLCFGNVWETSSESQLIIVGTCGFVRFSQGEEVSCALPTGQISRSSCGYVPQLDDYRQKNAEGNEQPPWQYPLHHIGL